MDGKGICETSIAMAVVQRANGNRQEAVALYHKALEADASSVEAWVGLALCQEELGNKDAARDALLHCLKQRPQTAYAHHRLGFLAYQQKHFTEALPHYQQAMHFAQGWYEPRYHAAACCQELRRYAEALVFYQQALERKADSPALWYHYAKALKDAGQLDSALQAYQHALMLKPDYADAQYSRGLLHLLRGDWLAGWPDYELRWQGSDRAAVEHRPVTTLPQWQGEDVLPDSGIVVYAEQGMGDSIQCFRYVEWLRERFARVKFCAPAPLVTLFQANATPELTIEPRIKTATDEAGYTNYIHSLSLPGVFKTTPTHLPAAPYLAPPKERMAYWQQRLTNEARPKVGVVWMGGKLSHAPARDMDFAYLMPLLVLQGICWMSLQKDEKAPAGIPMTDWMSEVMDFADTAALIASLDMIIAVDTSVAHLAGALGKPVWLLNRFESEWRWMRGRETTPWYPSMRIFNQPAPGDWAGVIQQVKSEICKCLL